MKQREEVVLALLEPGAVHAEVCRKYGISRPTGYKWLKRYRERGFDGLADMSRQPHSSPLKATGETVLKILELRRQHPGWGPKKIHKVLSRSEDDMVSVRTVARVLDRAGVKKRRTGRHKRRVESQEAPKVTIAHPNDVWTVDFKGWWKTQDEKRCEPLTVRDAHSYFVLAIQCMQSAKSDETKAVFERLFVTYGLPRHILVDNGQPFSSVQSRKRMTRLSAWWVSLGIDVVRSRVATPGDNAAHERLHKDMAFELELHPEKNLRLQQAVCDKWKHDFNHLRPHEALDMKVPHQVYQRSPRHYRNSRIVTYPDNMAVRKVTSGGRVFFDGEIFSVGKPFIGYSVGIQKVSQTQCRLWFYEIDLGLFSTQQSINAGQIS